MNGSKDSRFSTGVLIGLAMIGLGIVISFVLFLAGAITFEKGKDASLLLLASLGPLLVFAGILTVGIVIGIGLLNDRQQKDTGVLRIENGAWVQARFAMNEVNEMLFSEDHFDPWDPHVKLFVRLKYPDGRTDELDTSIEAWRTCGEGQVGIATIQGNWLTQFAPRRRV